jgi:hypothetical protein
MAYNSSFGVDFRATLLAGIALVLSTAASADVRVTKSNVPTIAKGSILKDDAILDVPPNKTVKVLMEPSKVSKVIVGPYKGTAKDYSPSDLPNAAAKPKVEFDPGTTINTPPPQFRFEK